MNSSTEAGIAAVVVTHESGSTIDDCLHRLRNALGVAQIRVVDNTSTDDTLEVVQRHALADPRVRFIANPDNPGFSVGCNQGAADSTAPWLAFVNPDCLVETDTLWRMTQWAAGEAPMVLGADLVDEQGVRDGAARRRDPDFAAMLSALAHGDSAPPLDIVVDESQAVQTVDAISGALMVLPRALFDRIGGFDEGYRLHAEDLDFCRRARAAGARVAVANGVRVLHVRGVSSRSRPLFVEWHKHRGLWRYFRTFEAPHRGLSTRVLVWAAIFARFPLAYAKALARVGAERSDGSK